MQEEKQTTTVVDDAERPVRSQSVSRTTPAGGVIARRVIYYIAGIIIALIALRFVFLLLGANRGSGFVDFLYDLTSVFVAPFNGIFGETQFGVSYFETSSLVAIVIYGLIAVGLGKLFTLNR